MPQLSKHTILIATHPFGKSGRKPLDLLEKTGWDLKFNPFGRRLKEGDIAKILEGVDAVIAGTEHYPAEILKKTSIKVISRVGIGLDSVPLKACQEMGIDVTYTPDAPTRAVAELALGNMINVSRFVLPSDHSVRLGAWNRLIGKLLGEMVIGIVGVGRIGKQVIRLLQPFRPKILVCDIKPDREFAEQYSLSWVDKKEIFQVSDLVTLHIPSNNKNRHYIDRKTLSLMKTGSYIVNTSRGPIVDEEALYDALIQKHLAGAALDVFKNEPYEGPLTKIDNVVLTAHIGASARASRYLMELSAAEDCIRVLNGKPPKFSAITMDNIKDQGI